MALARLSEKSGSQRMADSVYAEDFATNHRKDLSFFTANLLMQYTMSQSEFININFTGVRRVITIAVANQ